jgi:hypothetical protein
MATKTYRVAVLVEGRDEKIRGPRSFEKADVEAELQMITAAQRRGTEAVVALPWLAVREKAITAAFIEEGWANGGPAASPRRRWSDVT